MMHTNLNGVTKYYDTDTPPLPSALTVEELCSESYAIAASKGWHEEPHNFYERLMLVVSEISEAVEEKRRRRGYAETYYDEEGKPCGIPSEIADVFIRLADVCEEYEIPVVPAIREKMAYNRTRNLRHGGKEA